MCVCERERGGERESVYPIVCVHVLANDSICVSVHAMEDFNSNGSTLLYLFFSSKTCQCVN